MKNKTSITRFLCLFALMLPAPAPAETFEGITGVDLMPGWQTEQGAQMAGLRINLAPGWHTYWRAPGDSGIPPLFDWASSDNLKAVRIHWPRPEVFDLSGVRTLGYTEQVIFPIEFFARDKDQPIGVEGQMALGVCKDICLPVTLDLSGILGSSSPSATDRKAIEASLNSRPVSAKRAGAGQVVCKTATIDDGLKIVAEIPVRSQGGQEVVVIEPGSQGCLGLANQKCAQREYPDRHS